MALILLRKSALESFDHQFSALFVGGKSAIVQSSAPFAVIYLHAELQMHFSFPARALAA